MEYNNGYLNRAKDVVKEAEVVMQQVKRCIIESEGFPIYLQYLHELVDNLMYLNVMHNALLDYSRKPFSKKKRAKKKSK